MGNDDGGFVGSSNLIGGTAATTSYVACSQAHTINGNGARFGRSYCGAYEGARNESSFNREGFGSLIL